LLTKYREASTGGALRDTGATCGQCGGGGQNRTHVANAGAVDAFPIAT
jgi:hypothetical protein